MRIPIGLLCFVIAGAFGCSKNQTPDSSNPVAQECGTESPSDWSAHLGQTVTVEGSAAHDKGFGAVLLTDNGQIWIDRLDSWPQGDWGRRLRVTGILVKRDEMPVFVEKPGDLPRQGIPVESEAALEKAKWRYLLKDAKWTVVDRTGAP